MRIKMSSTKAAATAERFRFKTTNRMKQKAFEKRVARRAQRRAINRGEEFDFQPRDARDVV